MGIELSTNNSGTLPDFYDAEGRIQNPSDAQDLANLEAKLEKQHIEKVKGLESIEGGYLEELKPIYEQYPSLFNVLKDSRGETVLMSELLEGGTFGGYGGAVKAIIAWPDAVAVITKEDSPITPEQKEELSSPEPEILTKWYKGVSELRPDATLRIIPGSLDLHEGYYSELPGISIRTVMNKNGVSIASDSLIRPALHQLLNQQLKGDKYDQVQTAPLRKILNMFQSSLQSSQNTN